MVQILTQAGSSASKEKEEKPLSKKELAAKKKVRQESQFCTEFFKADMNLLFFPYSESVIKAEEDELSDEDKQLKEELELCVTRLGFLLKQVLVFVHNIIRLDVICQENQRRIYGEMR